MLEGLDELIPLKRVLSELKSDFEAERVVKRYKDWADDLFNALLK